MFETTNGVIDAMLTERSFCDSFLYFNNSQIGCTYPTDYRFPFDLIGTILRLSDADRTKAENLAHTWRGFICPLCKKCNQRDSWYEWKCGSDSCTFVQEYPVPIIAAKKARPTKGFDVQGFLPFDIKIRHDSKFLAVDKSCEPGLRHKLILGPLGASLQLLNPSRESMEAPDGADQFFDEIQECVRSKELPLRRAQRVAANTGGLSNHFSFDYSEDPENAYDFGVRTNHGQIADACAPSQKIQAKLERVSKIYGAMDWAASFSGQLPIMYLPGQDCKWHSDGNHKQVADTHASMSGGSSGHLQFRLKPSYHKHKGPAAPLVPGSLFYEDLLPYKFYFDKGRMDDNEFHKIVKEMRARFPDTKKSKIQNPA